MKKAFKFYIFFGIFVFVASCKPERLPQIVTEDPVFSVSGAIDITAGENDFYLFSAFEKDNLDVYSFVARFGKLSTCVADCNEALVIKIRDAQQDFGGGVSIDNALFVGDFDYYSKDPLPQNQVTLNLMAQPEGVAPFDYNWLVHYASNTDTFYTATFPLILDDTSENDPPEICLTINDMDNCQKEYCNIISLENDTTLCQANITFDSISATELRIEASYSNGTPFSYEWNNDSLGMTFIQNHGGFLNQNYCVTITDTEGCSDEICKEVLVENGGVKRTCGSRFSYQKTIELLGLDSIQLGTILIHYTDHDGQKHQSDLGQQPDSSIFSILAVDDFENNEDGEKTKKLTISGNCVLYNESGMLTYNNFPFEGVIAVAYP